MGRHVVAALRRSGAEVHAVTSRPPGTAEPTARVAGVHWHRCDLLDAPATGALIADLAPERLVHLAWYVEHGRFWTAPENATWARASMDLLRAFAAAGGRRAVFTGTCAEYDWSASRPLHEQDTPLVPATPYGQAKEALRHAATTFAVERGVDLAWARLFFLYGPDEPPARLVPSVIHALLAGEPAATTEGLQVRDFMHAEDAGAALAAVLHSAETGPINVASGVGVTLRRVIELIGEATGRSDLLRPGARPTAENDPARLVADTARLNQIVGFQPRIALREGIESTVAWWRDFAAGQSAP